MADNTARGEETTVAEEDQSLLSLSTTKLPTTKLSTIKLPTTGTKGSTASNGPTTASVTVPVSDTIRRSRAAQALVAGRKALIEVPSAVHDGSNAEPHTSTKFWETLGRDMASWRIDGKIGVKVVVTDLDSTLWIPGKFVPLANKKCLAALKERNIPVVFATGRSLEAVIRGCRRYGIDPLTSCYPGIFADGAVVLGRNEKEVLKYERMSQEHLERVLQVAVSLDPECIVVQCYLEGQLIYNADPLHYLDSIGGTLEHLDEDVINKVRIRGLYPSMDNPTTDTQMASSDVQDTVLDAVRPPSDVEDAEEDNPKGDAKGDTSPDGLTTTEGDFGVRVDDLGLHRVSAGADLETAAAEEVVFAETSDRPGSLRTGSGKTFTKQYLLTECFSVMLQSKALLDASDEVERQLGRIGLVTLFPEWDTIHIKPKGCDKMEAIKLLAAHLGWDVSRDVVALGDGHNDITMLEGVPHSIAMCSGEEDAVRAGKLVTPISAEQGGWGNILQELML